MTWIGKVCALVAFFFIGVSDAVATPICVIPIGGQSNAVGFGGDPVLSPTPPAGVYEFVEGSISALGQQRGMAPAFGSAFIAATGVSVIIVPVAVGSTAQTAQFGNYSGHGHWDVGGTMVPNALATIAAAFTAASAAGHQPRMCGMVWSQGEDEGVGFVTVPQIVDGTDYLTARFRAVYPGMPVYIVRTGTPTGSEAAYAGGFATIRDAQETRAQADSRTPIVSRLASDFVARGLMADDVHWNQQALNEVGIDAAANVVTSGLWNEF